MEALEDLLGLNDIGTVSIIDFLIGLFEVTLIAIIYKVIYDKYSTSISNRKVFSFQFIPFSISIFLIVVTIKSSLVLSLGLVGALSIIRFRTAIKETEQILSLLYLTGVAISVAANKFILPLITTLVLIIYFIVRLNLKSNLNNAENMVLLKFEKIDIKKLNKILKKIEVDLSINIKIVSLKEQKDLFQIVLQVSDLDLERIDEIKRSITESSMKIKELTMY